MRILLAEDERELSNALVAILRHNNYSVDAVFDGADALDYAIAGNYDALILDIMMPKMSGLEVVKALRAQGCTAPVIFLTAKAETQDKITGLDCGADDYLTKPFITGELLARLRALTRRKTDLAPNNLEFGNITLNRSTYELSGRDACFRLGNKEFQMLEMLMCSNGRLVSTDQFMEKIWGFDSEAEINVVWVYISYLRKKLLAAGANVEIKASRGAGYSLEIK